MGDHLTIIACLIVSALILLGLFRRGGTRNALFVVAAFFTLFAFGPVVNYLLGWEYYPGVIDRYIPKATIGFTLALMAMWFADRIRPQRNDYDLEQMTQSARLRYEFLPLGFLVVAGYALTVTVPHLPTLVSASKQQALAIAGPGHFAYLSVATAMTAFYFVSRRTPLMRQLYAFHCLTFVGYSLAFRERDFLLVFISVLIHREILLRKKRSAKVVLAGAASVVGATWLFSARTGGDGVSTEGVLNQGLLLFIDTYIMRLVPDSQPYEYGGTYVDAIMRIPPTFLYDSGQLTLSQKFVESYNPGGTVGYGFSLTAEAYMNFGMVGIPAVFLAVALVHRYLINRMDRGDWYPYASVFFTSTWMYALRGDSLQLMKTMLFGAIVFAVFRAFSTRAKEPVIYRPPVPWHRQPWRRRKQRHRAQWDRLQASHR